MSDKLGSRDVGFLDFECGKYPEEFPSFCTVHYNVIYTEDEKTAAVEIYLEKK